MKKILNIALSAVAIMGFTACDNDDVFTGIPVVNPQQEIMPADGIKATDNYTDQGSVDLSAMSTSDNVTMLNIAKVENLPASQTLSVVMNASASADMSASQAIVLDVVADPTGKYQYIAQTPALQLDEVFKTLVSREPTAKNLYVNYVAYATEGTTTVLLGSVGTAQTLSVTPFAYEHPLESAYYVYGTISGDNVASAAQLNHSGSLYDNPYFQIKVTVTGDDVAAGGWKFIVVPQSTVQGGKTWAENPQATFIGAGATEGTLTYATATEAPVFATINKPGSYMLKVNLLDLTYEVSNAIEYLYIPGDGSGWSFNTKIGTTDFIHYSGYAFLKGSFKFTGSAGWSADFGNYGRDGNDNYKLLNGSNDNFSVDGPEGLYRLWVDMSTLTYEKTLIENIGVVGSLNGWNAGSPILLTPSSDYLSWEGEVTMSAGDEFKFVMNKGWGLNLGGQEDNLVQDGGNLHAPGTGTYYVLLDLSVIPYQCYIEEQ